MSNYMEIDPDQMGGPVPDTVPCPGGCGQRHPVDSTRGVRLVLGADGERHTEPGGTSMQTVRCELAGKTYFVGLNGRAVK